MKIATCLLPGHACAVERAAAHFSGNALNCAAADADILGDRQHALTGPQLALDLLFKRGINLRSPELLALSRALLSPARTRS